MKPEMSSTPTDLNGLRGLVALKTSESETGAEAKNSEDVEKVWKKAGQRLLYNVFNIHRQHHKVLLNAYCQPQTV
jgi:hypothetical protein